jgi:hypothetical protein
MGRLNNWLIRRLDELPDPEPLPEKLEQLRSTIERRMSRAVLVTIFAVGVYSIAARFLLPSPYGIWLLIPLMFGCLFATSLAMSYHSRMAVRDYARWLKQQPPTPSRVMRMGVPYERQPPTALVECLDCPARTGQRHSRKCPSVPPEWFNRGR